MIKSFRERLLAAAAAATVAAALLLESGYELPLHPFADLDLAIADATSQADAHEVEVNRLLHDLNTLEHAAQLSLPPDPGQASALYQAWLIQQLADSGIEAATVSPAPAIPDEFLGNRLPFSIECDASAAALAQFIDRFSNTPLLHRFTSLQIVNTSSGFDDLHRLAVSIEALALPNALERELLPAPSNSANSDLSLTALLENSPLLNFPQPPPPELPPATSDPAQNLTQSNPQQTPATQPQPIPDPTPPEPPAPPKPKYSPGQSLQFIGSILSGQDRHAWFLDRRSGDEFFATTDGDVAIPDLTVKILSVADDNVVILYKSKRVRLKLGQTAALPPAPLYNSPTSPTAENASNPATYPPEPPTPAVIPAATPPTAS